MEISYKNKNRQKFKFLSFLLVFFSLQFYRFDESKNKGNTNFNRNQYTFC